MYNYMYIIYALVEFLDELHVIVCLGWHPGWRLNPMDDLDGQINDDDCSPVQSYDRGEPAVSYR
jgi:hypothetical protein